MSPNPIWNVVLFLLGAITFSYIFVYFPFLYFYLGRPFDKKYKIVNYTIERGVFFHSALLRTINIATSIVLQPYRNKKIKNKIFSIIVKRRFIYQDNLYGKKLDLRANATNGQIFAAKLFYLGAAIMLITLILVLFHNFVLYPEFARHVMEHRLDR